MNNRFDKLRSEIGDSISVNRKLKGYSQEDFSYMIGISRRSLSKIENGHSYPSLITTSLIDEFLDISIADIIKSSSTNPSLHLSMLYSQFLYYLDNRDHNKIIRIFKLMSELIRYIPTKSLEYKKYLFTKSWVHIINNQIPSAYEALTLAYNLRIKNNEDDKILDYKIFLLKESIAPDLEDSSEKIDEVANSSIRKLKEKAEELEAYPDLKMKYLYNALVIKIGNLKDYTADFDLLTAILDLSMTNHHLMTYFQTLFYRGIINYYNGNTQFYLDIDEALTYFYIKENHTFFDLDVNLLRDTIFKEC